MSLLASKLELHLSELRRALDEARAARDGREFRVAVLKFLEASYQGNVELDRVYKLLKDEIDRAGSP